MIIIYSPPLNVNNMESIACHKLNDIINSTNIIKSSIYDNNIQIDDKTLVIYTESAIGNPLQAKKYMKWIINDQNFIDEEEDCLIYFRVDKEVHNIHPKDSICLNDLDNTSQVFDILSESEYFFCYDPYCLYLPTSLMLHCIPIVYPLYEKLPKKCNYGIVYSHNLHEVEKVKQYITTDTFKKDITELLEKSKKSFLLFMKEQVSDLQTKKFFLLSDEDTNVTDKKNILIYGHTPFRKNDGGIMAQYNLAYLLNKFGENVKILNIFDGNKENPIYNNFYNNDFSRDNTVVIYCEDIKGNPLGAKYVVRWMLSELGKNVPKENRTYWGSNERVYFFNYDPTVHVLKTLSYIYLDEKIYEIYEKMQKDNNKRHGFSFTIRKAPYHHKTLKMIHPNGSSEIERTHTFQDYIDIFSCREYFISYDPFTFLQMIAVFCGCVCIIYPIEGMSKEEWYRKTAFYQYMKDNELEDLGGIAYGWDDKELERAKNTVGLLMKQISDINEANLEGIKQFVNEINNWDTTQENKLSNVFI